MGNAAGHAAGNVIHTIGDGVGHVVHDTHLDSAVHGAGEMIGNVVHETHLDDAGRAIRSGLRATGDTLRDAADNVGGVLRPFVEPVIEPVIDSAAYDWELVKNTWLTQQCLQDRQWMRDVHHELNAGTPMVESSGASEGVVRLYEQVDDFINPSTYCDVLMEVATLPTKALGRAARAESTAARVEAESTAARAESGAARVEAEAAAARAEGGRAARVVTEEEAAAAARIAAAEERAVATRLAAREEKVEARAARRMARKNARKRVRNTAIRAARIPAVIVAADTADALGELFRPHAKDVTPLGHDPDEYREPEEEEEEWDWDWDEWDEWLDPVNPAEPDVEEEGLSSVIMGSVVLVIAIISYRQLVK